MVVYFSSVLKKNILEFLYSMRVYVFLSIVLSSIFFKTFRKLHATKVRNSIHALRATLFALLSTPNALRIKTKHASISKNYDDQKSQYPVLDNVHEDVFLC